MDDILVPGSTVDMEFIEQNPEAIFDFISMKSIQERFGHIESPRGSIHDRYSENEAVYQNEIEFETFVQQFPIDDSIAECFAATNDSVASKQETKFVSGGKRPQVATKYSKLKKKFGFKGSDDTSLLSEDEVRSRDSKRSKKGGGVFSKRHKWRNLNSKKAVNFSDQCDKSGSETTSDIASSSQRTGSNNCSDDVNRTDSCSISDSQITSFSETFSQEMDQTVPVKSSHLPWKIPERHSSTLNMNIYKNRNSSPKECEQVRDIFTDTLSGSSSDIMQKIEDMQPGDVLKLRDHHGNNLLHRAVLLGNADVIKYILEKFPEMTSEMNLENETAIEIAAKFGKYDCLSVILERNQRRNSSSLSLINRLLNVCAQFGQADCLSLLLTYLSRDPQSSCMLPGDSRGNTAAHLAARHGHIHCLQALVAAGYDVTSGNLMQQRPLHVAHQSRSHACFEYLLLLNVCEELWSSLRTNVHLNARLSEQVSSVKPSLEHVRLCLNRYGDLCSETSHLLTENKNNILETLNKLEEDLQLFVKHTSMDSATKRKEARDKLEELRGEIERLEDTFEFSPLSEMDDALLKLFSSIDDVILPTDDQINRGEIDENGSKLSSLIRDIHKEYMLENWETSSVYDKYLKVNKISTEVFARSSHETNVKNEKMQPVSKNTDQPLVAKLQTPNVQSDGRCSLKESMSGVQNVSDSMSEWKETNTAEEDRTISNKTDTNFSTESDLQTCNMENSADLKSPHITQTKNTATVPCLQSEDECAETEISVNHLVTDSKIDNEKTENDCIENENPTERPFTKLLSLDERIDLLIAGERTREKGSDSEHTISSSESKDSNPDVGSLGSIYTSTFTSITSETSGASDWYSKLGLTSLETTSSDDVTNDTTTDSASYWWDIGNDNPDVESRNFKVSFPYGNDIRRKIHLNLENDGSTFDELREHRLRSHLRSMQQTRFSSDNYRERITTSTGEIMGGFQHPHTGSTGDVTAVSRPERSERRVIVDVNGALLNRNARSFNKPRPKPRKRGKPQLFTLEDAIATKPITESEFRERYDRRSAMTSGPLNMRWENMSVTDEEEDRSMTWSDYGRSYIYGIRSDTDTTSGSQTPQSYV
ncbi:synphilin-1-like isoform X2 [Mercenaria mercenaria]|nr:synphilin-1-like isoform X2 [Mercenaria mercenaria]XP_053386914.1 synphilin-1-like isoform X2 [Mercenaria mercenaria]XP_053386915.1 synphilin-1-like isoform X2 [Mercenaria mercenaria]